MFETIIGKINGNQGVVGVALIFILFGNLGTNWQADQAMKSSLTELSGQVAEIKVSLYEMKYSPSYEIIRLGLATMSHQEAIAQIKKWVDDKWVAKIANLTTLCEEPDRKLLIELTGSSTRSADYCMAMA